MVVRLLFDENLSVRIARVLVAEFPGSAHVSDLGLQGASDDAVWDAARTGGYVLVTKDEDFQRLSITRGAPPKVVWLRIGNCSTADAVRLLRLRRPEIERFVVHEDATILALG